MKVQNRIDLVVAAIVFVALLTAFTHAQEDPFGEQQYKKVQQQLKEGESIKRHPSINTDGQMFQVATTPGSAETQEEDKPPNDQNDGVSYELWLDQDESETQKFIENNLDTLVGDYMFPEFGPTPEHVRKVQQEAVDRLIAKAENRRATLLPNDALYNALDGWLRKANAFDAQTVPILELETEVLKLKMELESKFFLPLLLRSRDDLAIEAVTITHWIEAFLEERISTTTMLKEWKVWKEACAQSPVPPENTWISRYPVRDTSNSKYLLLRFVMGAVFILGITVALLIFMKPSRF